MNWPVAFPVSKYLISISENLTDEILIILKGDDPTWKYWTINLFGLNSNKPLDNKLIEEIQRIAIYPTFGEKQDEVDEIAKAVIASL